MEPRAQQVDDLLRIVGQQRDRHTPEEVAAAEQRLCALAEGDRQDVRRRVRRNGWIVAVIGLVVGVWPLCVLGLHLSQQRDWGPPPPEFGWFVVVFVALCVVQTVCGLALCAGGIGFARCREWGRKLVLAVLWVAIAYCVGFGVFWEIFIPLNMGWQAHTVVSMVFGPAICAFWAFLLWLPKRYVSSDAVRAACRETDARTPDDSAQPLRE